MTNLVLFKTFGIILKMESKNGRQKSKVEKLKKKVSWKIVKKLSNSCQKVVK
jgi:hypothetical protein